eukprot:Gb_13439 [translate_table: standard]
MSVPIGHQPGTIYQPVAESSGSETNGSAGAVLAVLAVVIFLGVIAFVIGNVCAGRLFKADSKEDCVGWMERWCSACIDGDLESAGRPASIPVAKPAENGENKPPEEQCEMSNVYYKNASVPKYSQCL